MPKIIGKGTIVVEHDGLTINELVGNVGTRDSSNCDDISVAHVTVVEPTAEPWLTLDYDEWICLLKGTIEMKYCSDSGEEISLTIQTGETCFISKGERFRPVFPYGAAEYIAICSPAFSPARCQREEDAETSQVTARLRELHNAGSSTKNVNGTTNNHVDATSFNMPTELSDIIYHMCEKKVWDDAVQAKRSYFPPTFEVDGGFTHATAVPERLIDTANHFYTQVAGDWICLQLSIKALHNMVGIVTRYENPKPVGMTSTDSQWSNWACPHIFGGIPTQVDGIVQKTFPIERDASTGNFVRITGLT
jgi:uncharacterized protein (DUF952 family)